MLQTLNHAFHHRNKLAACGTEMVCVALYTDASFISYSVHLIRKWLRYRYYR